MPSAHTSAVDCTIAVVFSWRDPSAGTGTSGWISARSIGPSYQSVTGNSAAPVRWASAAGPAGIRVGSPKKSTSIPAAERSRSPTRQTSLPSRSRRASVPITDRSEPVSASTSMPRPSRYATKRSNSDSGLSRSATVVNGYPPAEAIHAPARSQLAMCGSARTAPRPAAITSSSWSRFLTVMASPIRSRLQVGSRNDSIQYRR
ncbi:hypothetical protein GCM10025734_69180 [Kitasatospora paranensis]